jgi:hypothetical protein
VATWARIGRYSHGRLKNTINKRNIYLIIITEMSSLMKQTQTFFNKRSLTGGFTKARTEFPQLKKNTNET